MSAWLGRRAEPRVDFREAVRVIWPGEVSGVLARAVNLSSSGILVDAPTPTPCPVGSDVLCDLTLPRGPRLLRGRVAHRRVLPSEKVGMGIEFVDLSPREAAELRDVVGDGEEKPQRVKVRFKGTNHVVSARAVATEDGFRLVTALPFLAADTEVDIALSPDASVSAQGWVSLVSLERASAGGAPRLLIDVRVEDPDPWRDRSSARTPVVESLVETIRDAVPEHIWEPDQLGATAEPASFGVPVDLADDVPTIVTGAIPSAAAGDPTEIVTLDSPPWRARALGGGVIAGAIALVALVAAIALVKTAGPRNARPLSISPPVSVTERSPPAAPVAVRAPAPLAREAVAPRPAPAAARADEPAPFVVGLTGSLAGAKRYPLRNPDGVAFNLPGAQAALKLGTYAPAVPGLKSMWVRALPGGGTHLRFFFTSPRPAPRVVLERDGVHVGAR